MDDRERGLGGTARASDARGLGQAVPPVAAGSAVPAPAARAGSQPDRPDEATRARWRAEATAEIARRQQARAPRGWRVASVEVNLFDLHELAQRGQVSEYDYEIAATVTFERIEKGPSPSDINHSWRRETYNVGELIRGERPSTRTPLVTRRMLDSKSEQVTQALRGRLQEAAEEQLLGIRGPDFSDRAREEIDQLITLCETRIETARSDEDFAKAAEELAKLQQVDQGRDEIDALAERLGERYAQQQRWKEEAARDRPTSKDAARRYYEAEAVKQQLGASGAVSLPAIRALSAEERALVEARGKALAAQNVPRGGRLLSVTVDIAAPQPAERLTGRLPDVTITYSYLEALNARGIPAERIDQLSISHEELLAGDEAADRKPVVVPRARGDYTRI